jgi:hypothetical protein
MGDEERIRRVTGELVAIVEYDMSLPAAYRARRRAKIERGDT